MKNLGLLFLLVSINLFAQSDMRGPMNSGVAPGIVDGIVMSNEVPMRSKVPYEHVRLADYVWSKRVFSRIDAREKLNHDIFYPFDFFNYEEFKIGDNFDETYSSIFWTKNNERLSLWTIILKHILRGDLRVYSPFDHNAEATIEKVRDGYQFKYPIISVNGSRSASDGIDALFNDDVYQKAVLRKLASYKLGEEVELKDEFGTVYKAKKTNITADEAIGNQASVMLEQLDGTEISLYDMIGGGMNPATEALWQQDRAKFIKAWKNSKVGEFISTPPEVKLLSSQAIAGYNIKEDWFFDKERSILDKRIIAIAPIANFAVDKQNPKKADESNILYVDSKTGQFKSSTGDYGGTTFQTEMFWLYFPQLRDVMVNYFTYSDRSDAQWSSFDDLFWKRKFKGQIYKTSDKFDRDIQDYRFGVDALYEAEKVKGEIRKWENDVWNY